MPGPYGLIGGVCLLTLVLLGGLYARALLRELQAKPARSPIIYSSLPEFTLTNQLGQAVTLAGLRGHIWVADFIFTRCAGPCPKMTAAMSRLQEALCGQGQVRLVTVTADPANDTPAVMEHYSQRYHGRADQWWFLTGDKKEIERLAVDGFKLVAKETDATERQAGEDLFIHSTKFVLVDPQGRVRGYYDGTDPSTQEKILHDIAALQRAG